MTPATLREQAAMRHADAWDRYREAHRQSLAEMFWAGIVTAFTDAHLTDARDTYYTARDALTAAREESR